MRRRGRLPSAPPAPPGGDRPIAALPRCAASRRRSATLLVVSMLVFAGTEVLPGDAASAVLGKTATPAQVAELRTDDGPRPPDPGALRRLARRVRARRPRRLGGGLRGRRQAADLGPDPTRASTASLWLAGITALLMIPLSLAARRRRGAPRRPPADVAISIDSLAIISLPEFVIGSLLILVLFSWLDALPPVALLEPGESPLAHAAPARPAGAHAARRDARGVRAHDARRDDPGAALGLRRDGAAERLPRAARRLAPRAAQRARAGGAGLRPEPAVPDRRRDRRRVPLRATRGSARSSSTRSRSATCARCSRSRS